MSELGGAQLFQQLTPENKAGHIAISQQMVPTRPAFQRHHMSVCCAAESPARFPWVIDTTFEEEDLY